MESLDTYSLLKQSPQEYFKDALELFHKKQLPAALQALDVAIVFSHNSPFYIYQKIRLLYQIGANQSCNELIVSQLEHLYKHGSLYILCRSLDYLQKATPYPISELRTLLYEHGVPYCLADFYGIWLVHKEKPFFKLAKKAMYQDHHELCLAYCDLYLKLHETNAELCYMQGYCHHMLGNLMLSKNYYTEYIKFNPNEASGYIHLGFISTELGDYEIAREQFERAISIEPDNVDYQLYLGECYYMAKKYKEATAIYERMNTEDSSNLQSCFNLSHTYQKMSKNRLSKRYIKQITKHLKNRV